MEDPMLGGGDVILNPKQKTGFPFDDSDPPSFGRPRNTFRPFRHHLDDIASRHPEFAEHLRPWASDFPEFQNTAERHFTSETDSSAPNTSSQTSNTTTASSQNAQKPPRHNIPHYGLRNTVDLGEKQKEQSELDEKVRNQRSMSAPPDNRTNQPQQRFVSRVNIEPQDPSQHSMSGNSTAAPESQPSQQKQPNVRHIPIFVEGRDEPILPKNVADEVDSSFNKSPHYDQQTKFPTSFVHKEIPKPHIEEHFDQPFPSTFYHPPRTAQPFVPFHQQAAEVKPPQPREIPVKVQHVTRQQRAPSPQPKQQQQQKPQPQPHPQSQSQQQHQQAQPQQQPQPPSQPQPQPQAHPQQQQQLSNDPIIKIQEVQRDVNELMNLVEQYQGNSKKDKQYIYLDEMLTRNLIKLDNIDTQGKDTIRQARKEAIKCIQKCISILESKVTKAMENNQQTSDDPSVTETAATAENSQDKMECEPVELQQNAPEKMEAEPIETKTENEQPLQTLEVSGVVKSGTQVVPESAGGDTPMHEVTDGATTKTDTTENTTTNSTEPNEKSGEESQKKKGKKIVKKKPRSQSSDKSGGEAGKPMEIDDVQKTVNSESTVDDTSQKN